MKNIFTKYFEGKASAAEQGDLLTWLRNSKGRKVFQMAKELWTEQTENAPVKLHLMGSWSKMRDKLQIQKQFDLISQRYRFMKYAAIGLLTVSLSVSYFLFDQKYDKVQFVDTSVSTQNGQVSKINLPDGSEVWINSATKLTYNNQFGITNRDLLLVGEAFFYVEKNKDIPFQVQGGDLVVTAIGTEFYVSNYNETGKIDVILKEGAVKVNSKKDNKLELTMKPGESVSYHLKDEEITRRNVNPQHFISWKDGIIHFNNLRFDEIAFRLEKRYNQKIKLGDNVKDLHFKFSITNENLDEVIDIIELLSGIEAESIGDTICFNQTLN